MIQSSFSDKELDTLIRSALQEQVAEAEPPKSSLHRLFMAVNLLRYRRTIDPSYRMNPSMQRGAIQPASLNLAMLAARNPLMAVAR
jgi:hypothetical protein